MEAGCGEAYFRCNQDGRCIGYELQCNGVEECSDGSDERDCGNYAIHTTKHSHVSPHSHLHTHAQHYHSALDFSNKRVCLSPFNLTLAVGCSLCSTCQASQLDCVISIVFDYRCRCCIVDSISVEQ